MTLGQFSKIVLSITWATLTFISFIELMNKLNFEELDLLYRLCIIINSVIIVSGLLTLAVTVLMEEVDWNKKIF